MKKDTIFGFFLPQGGNLLFLAAALQKIETTFDTIILGHFYKPCYNATVCFEKA